MSSMDEKRYSRYFKAIGDPSRLRILSLLARGELSVGDIAHQLGLAQPTVSRHLGILRDADIVFDRRDGQQVFYRLNRETVQTCCEGFCDCLSVAIPAVKTRKK